MLTDNKWQVLEVISLEDGKYLKVKFFRDFLKTLHPGWNCETQDFIAFLTEERGSMRPKNWGNPPSRISSLHKYTAQWSPRSKVLFPLFKEIVAQHLGEQKITFSNNAPTCTCDFSKGNWACTCGAMERERQQKKTKKEIGNLPF